MEKIKQTIYRKALGMLQIKYSDVTDSSDTAPAEIEYCNDNIDTACASAMSGGDYFWLISSYKFSSPKKDSDGKLIPYHGYQYGYDCPSDMFRPFLGDGKYNFGYARKGKEIYFPVENPTLDYIVDVTKKYDDDDFWADMPSVFIDLIAGMLAISIAPMVAPEGTFGQNATTKMQTAAAACNDLNNNAYREYRPNPKEYLE